MGIGNILIIASNKTLVDQLIALLRAEGFSQIEYAVSTSDARKKIGFLDPDIVIINSPICGEPRSDFILDLSEKTTSHILVLTPSDAFTEMQYDLQHIGAIIISKPLNRSIFIDTLHFMAYFSGYLSSRVVKSLSSYQGNDDKALVAKSKDLLIQNLHLSEPCAHRYIQKQSMNLRTSQVKVALQIIDYFSK